MKPSAKSVLVIFLVTLSLTIGCATGGTNADRRLQIVKRAVANMPPPSRALSSYANYELLPMKLSQEVAEDEKKVAYATELETLIKGRLAVQFSNWRDNSTSGTGTLRIQPDLLSLRIVSAGARFWVGAWAGSSDIRMDLVLTDAASGEVVARPDVSQTADAMAGAWSSGSTDRNLINYVVDISTQYLIENY